MSVTVMPRDPRQGEWDSWERWVRSQVFGNAPSGGGASVPSGGTSTLSGGSTSGGSRGGGGGGGGPRVRPANYLETPQSLGMPLNAEIQGLAARAAGAGWTQSEFMYHLRRTQAYRQRFRGIRPGQSEADYIQFENVVQSNAQTYGLGKVGRKIVARLNQGRVHPEVVQARFEAMGKIRRHMPSMRQFERTLKLHGMMPRGRKLRKADMLKFATNKAPRAWYRMWEEAFLRAGAARQGFQVGQVGDPRRPGQRIGRNLVQRISRHADIESLGQAEEHFANLARMIKTALPMSQLTGLGITKRDLVDLEFGGPRRLEAEQKVERVIETFAGRFEDPARATPGQGQGVVDPGGRRRSR